MKAKIGVSLLPKLTPQDKPFEVYDTELKGFTLRVQPNGTMIYLVRYRLADGKQTRASIGKHPAMKPANARDKALKILAGIVDGVDPAKEKKTEKAHTFISFIEEVYGPWVETNRKDGKATVARLKSCLPDFHKKKLTEITPWIVEKWRTERLKAGRQATTINRDLTALKACLSKSVEWNHLDIHPLSKIKPAKVDNDSRVRYLTESEETALMDALNDREQHLRSKRKSGNEWRNVRSLSPRPDLSVLPFADHLKPMVVVSVNTGLRWGELVALTWDNVDMDNANLTITGTTAKSGKTRHVPMNTTTMSVLKKWRQQSPGAIVFPGRDGGTLDNVNRSWNAVLKTVGITDFRWHDLRHHFASKLVMAGVDLNTVRELLGHSDMKMTLRYAHLAPEHKAAAVAKLVNVVNA